MSPSTKQARRRFLSICSSFCRDLHNFSQHAYVIISIRYREILAEYKCHDGFENKLEDGFFFLWNNHEIKNVNQNLVRHNAATSRRLISVALQSGSTNGQIFNWAC